MCFSSDFVNSESQLRLTGPEVTCKHSQTGRDGGPDVHMVYLRWNVRNLANKSTDLPLTFVVGMRRRLRKHHDTLWGVLGKVRSFCHSIFRSGRLISGQLVFSACSENVIIRVISPIDVGSYETSAFIQERRGRAGKERQRHAAAKHTCVQLMKGGRGK